MKVIIGAPVTLGRHRFGYQDFYIGFIAGMSRLGHEVYLFQEVDPSKECYDSDYKSVSFDKWKGREFFASFAKSLGIWPRSCLFSRVGPVTEGIPLAAAVTAAKEADLLLNFDGCLKSLEGLEHVPTRVYIDNSAGKTMVYKAEYNIDPGLQRHNHFFTFGLNIGTSKSDIPTLGLPWKVLPECVILADWPSTIDEGCTHFTTITSWSGRPTYDFKGRYSGEKSDEWKKFIELPRYTNQPLEIALDLQKGILEEMQSWTRIGWSLMDTRRFHCLQDYRSYIANSRAEFTAMHSPFVYYNMAACGQRMMTYLASGKPVLMQSTGIEDHFPTGLGLLTFKTMEEALAGIERINKDYSVHCKAARAIAEEFFDSDKVLSQMLRQLGC